MEFFRKIFNYSPSSKAEMAFAWGKELDGMDDVSAIEYATQQLNADAKKDISICDIGCGSGEMLRLVAKKAKQKERKVILVGVDANPNITGFAEKHSKEYDNIQFEALNIFSKEFRQKKFDVVLATLFFHHFDDDQLIAFFRQLKTQVSIGIVINDIHRHALAYHSIRLLTTFFSTSSMVKFDAPLSVLRAFKKNELIGILEKAQIKNYSLKWKWAFRWQLIVPIS